MTTVARQAREWAARADSQRMSTENMAQLKSLLSPVLKPLMDMTRAGHLVAERRFSQVVEEASETDQHAFKELACHLIATHKDNKRAARNILKQRFLDDTALDSLLDGLNAQVTQVQPTITQVQTVLERCYEWYAKYQPILKPTEEGAQHINALRTAIDQAKEKGLLGPQTDKKAALG